MARSRPVGVYMAALVLAVAIPLCAVLGYTYYSAAQRDCHAANTHRDWIFPKQHAAVQRLYHHALIKAKRT